MNKALSEELRRTHKKEKREKEKIKGWKKGLEGERKDRRKDNLTFRLTI